MPAAARTGKRGRPSRAGGLTGALEAGRPPGAEAARVAGRPLLHLVLLVALTVAAYANSLSVPFVLDDELHIIQEEAIRSPLSVSRILATPRPAVTASLALNHAIGGLDVRGYHLVNLVAHIACGLLLYALARQTLRRVSQRTGVGRAADDLALVVAAVFLVHPIQTESVTYVVQRSEILAAASLLGAVWVSARAAASGHRWRHLVVLGPLLALGMLGKPLIVVAPALFALYDWCFLAEGRVGRMMSRWPTYLALAAATGVTLLRGMLGVTGGTGLGQTAGLGMVGISPWRYLTWQFGVLLYYARLIVLPDRLCFDCGYFGPWPVAHSALGEAVWAPFALLTVGLAAAAAAWRRRPEITFGVLGSAVVLAPTSSLLPLADVYVEHRLYLPVGLLAMAVVPAVLAAGEALARAGWLPATGARRLMAGLAIGVTLALAGLTAARNTLYADPLRLWQDSVAKAPENDRAHVYLAREYERRGQRELAVLHNRQAILRNAYLRVGAQRLEGGQYPEAIAVFEWVRERRSWWPIVHQYLVRAYEGAGRLDDALASAERAAALAPASFTARRMLGDLYARTGRTADALREYRVARSLDPANADLERRIRALEGGG